MAVNAKIAVSDKGKKPPKHPWKSPFLALVVGPIGSGKTSVVQAIMTELDDHFDRAIYYSGNGLDSKLDRLGEGVEVIRDKPEELELALDSLETEQKARKKVGMKLMEALIVIDDSVASGDVFSGRRGRLPHFILSLRHLRTSIIITSQQWTLIPKVIRLNAGLWFVFRLTEGDASNMIADAPFPKRQFQRAYMTATMHPHDFLYANLKTRQLFRGFDLLIE